MVEAGGGQSMNNFAAMGNNDVNDSGSRNLADSVLAVQQMEGQVQMGAPLN